MLPAEKENQHSLPRTLEMGPAEPLYKRLPREDEHGKPLTDFMMIIPKLRTQPEHMVQETIHKIEQVLERYSNIVVFADLNLKLNVLWVIVRPVAGSCWKLPMEINSEVPEALLVAQPA
ncbi:MAG: hypothetical protein BMS9Abin08_1459 [Gammaproteobacteria bacterium]|nr:MAG: hypothetical protein BMS9Abin08_1459 [Gammaproteobacteria bacterium]